MHGMDYIFHAAALKQVPSCEFFPIEAVKTNVLGTENVLTAAIEAGVKKVICLSTDKAAYPVNAMGTFGIRHGKKMYETLLTNEECGHAIDMGNFYRVPCDKRDLNYDKYFKEGDVERNPLTEFNSNNTELLNVEQVKEKLLSLSYIQDELKEWEERK